MDRLSDFRRVFASVVTARAGVSDARIEQAFACVPRDEFVGPGPWRLTEDGPSTSSSDPALLYQDVALGLVRERGITTGLPSLHARCMAACRPNEGERVLHIGTGSGYFTAILAELVGSRGHVDAYEIDRELADRARENLRPWPNVEVHARSGCDALDAATDVIYVCAGVQQLPLSWLEALRDGGRLIFPLTPGTDEGGMLLVRRAQSNSVFPASFLCRARFIPCVGATDDSASERLAKAFRDGSYSLVNSLRVAPEEPDPSAG